MIFRLPVYLALSILAFCLQTAHSAQVLWGSARLAQNYVSSGEPNALGSDFTFQLGSFEEGFTPTADNVSSWLANWVPAQSVDYNANTRFFTGSFSYQTSKAPFTPSDQAYIFGFDRWAASEGDNKAEWILVTDQSWRWPAAIGGIAPPVQWSMSNASSVILGSVNAPNSAAHMQTASVPTPLEFLNLEFWSKRYGLGIDDTALASDSDGDGLTNAMEFALSTNPEDPSDGRNPIVSLVAEDGIQFTDIAFFKGGLVGGVTLGVDVSEDLINWAPASDEFDVIDNSILIYRVRSKLPPSPDGVRFYRINADVGL